MSRKAGDTQCRSRCEPCCVSARRSANFFRCSDSHWFFRTGGELRPNLRRCTSVFWTGHVVAEHPLAYQTSAGAAILGAFTFTVPSFAAGDDNGRRALCGACKSGFDYDAARNRCARCASLRQMLMRAGVLFSLILGLNLLVFLLCVSFRHRFSRLLLRTIKHHAKEFAGDGVGPETQLAVFEDEFKSTAGQTETEEQQGDERKAESQKKFQRSMLTKLKVRSSLIFMRGTNRRRR